MRHEKVGERRVSVKIGFFLAHYPRPPAHVWGKVWVRFGYLRGGEVEIKGDKKGDKK